MYGEQIGFANPLMRSALYQAASPEERRLAHARIAAALVEPRYRDRRAVHLGKAATGPDDAIAAELDGGRAVSRTGGIWRGDGRLPTRGGASEHDPDRCRRLWLAARRRGRRGGRRRALRAARSHRRPGAESLAADVEYLRARIEIRSGRTVDAADVFEAEQKLERAGSVQGRAHADRGGRTSSTRRADRVPDAGV